VRRSGTIGFVGDTVATTPYAVGMVLGALEAARAADRVVLLMNSGGHRDLEARELATLRQYQAVGQPHNTSDRGSDRPSPALFGRAVERRNLS
jgi:DNA-binding LacI/PurR family transcriptional regulator